MKKRCRYNSTPQFRFQTPSDSAQAQGRFPAKGTIIEKKTRDFVQTGHGIVKYLAARNAIIDNGKALLFYDP